MIGDRQMRRWVWLHCKHQRFEFSWAGIRSQFANIYRAESQSPHLEAQAVLSARHSGTRNTLRWDPLYLEVCVEYPDEGAHFWIAGTFQDNEASWPVLTPWKRKSTKVVQL